MIDSIKSHIAEYEKPKRIAISRRFPILVKPAVFTKRLARSLKNRVFLDKLSKQDFLPSIIARHSSLLYRRLGDSDSILQINKVTNLKIAVEKLDGLVIPPGQTFSLWNIVGRINKEKGYAEGMIISNGKVSEGLGGGLCQLSNFLFWIFLHADVEILTHIPSCGNSSI